MTPVVNPWIFYLMTVSSNLSCVSTIVMIASLIALFILGLVYLVNFGYYNEDDDVMKLKRIAKLLLVILVISAILACFIPGEQTIIKMVVAQNVTYERVEVVSDTVVTVYNDIMALFGEASGG